MLNLVRAEILKISKLGFIRVAVLVPPGVCLVILAILFIFKLAGNDFGNIPSSSGFDRTGPDLGDGAFAFGGAIFLTGIASFYALGLVIVSGLIIQNEYNWSTIKMLAIREPSRTRLMLTKVAFMVVFALTMFALFVVSWLIYSMGLKLVYGLPLGFGADDSDAILKGIKYIGLAFFFYLVWSLLGVALAVRFKSLIAAIIAYIVVSGLDGVVSAIGAAGLTGRLGTSFPAWLDPLIQTAKFVSPFLLNTSFTRLTGQSGDPTFVQSIAPVQSLLVLLVWGGLFVGLALWVFNTRDITD
jgi:ABC-2 type transport system permease protein